MAASAPRLETMPPVVTAEATRHNTGGRYLKGIVLTVAIALALECVAVLVFTRDSALATVDPLYVVLAVAALLAGRISGLRGLVAHLTLYAVGFIGLLVVVYTWLYLALKVFHTAG